MKQKIFFFLILCKSLCMAQSNPQALVPGITIQRILTVHKQAIRLALDPISKHFFYNDGDGNIYQINIPISGQAIDTLVFTTADHQVDYPQCIAFFDSVLYVSGNINPYKKLTTGIISKGVLQANGSRLWSTVMETEPYQTADYFDHLMSGMVISPQGDSITICSGARGDHGEIETRYNFYPNLRNVPLTTLLFRVPTATYTYLFNDSAWLDSSGFVYARGIRNTFSMAYDANEHLFGVENSCGRDHNEEMNWLQRGKHYGFPYVMGDTYNPQQYSTYNPFTDKLISHYNRSWRIGAWVNDPGFPAPPAVNFEAAIQNIGPDCDKFRDSITGGVLDASDLGISMGSFTAHRSPLGLVFDKDSLLDTGYTGDAFMLSWSKGLDSCGCTAVPDSATGPFVDPSQDLVHLKLMFDSVNLNYRLSATRIVEGFSHPVDAVIDSNFIYVLENGNDSLVGLYKIILPKLNVGVKKSEIENAVFCFPNPAQNSIGIHLTLHESTALTIQLFDSKGRAVISLKNKTGIPGENNFILAATELSNGIYTCRIESKNFSYSNIITVLK